MGANGSCASKLLRFAVGDWRWTDGWIVLPNGKVITVYNGGHPDAIADEWDTDGLNPGEYQEYTEIMEMREADPDGVEWLTPLEAIFVEHGGIVIRKIAWGANPEVSVVAEQQSRRQLQTLIGNLAVEYKINPKATVRISGVYDDDLQVYDTLNEFLLA